MRYLLVTLLFLGTIVQAQDAKRFPLSYPNGIGKDIFGLAKEPFKNKKKTAIQLGVFTAASFTLYQFDDEIQAWSQSIKSHSLNEWSEYVFEPVGAGVYPLAVAGGMAVGGLLFKNEAILETSVVSIESFLVAGLMSRIPKLIFGRRRPHFEGTPIKNEFLGPMLGGHDNFKSWLKHYSASSHSAYVSGHTTAAFALMTAFAEQYRKYNDGWVVPALCYTVAGISGVSRLYDNKHWATDVLGGACLGYITAKYLVNNHHWEIRPFVQGEARGIGFSIQI